jgi:hypothetical protein
LEVLCFTIELDGDLEHNFQIHNPDTRGKTKFLIKGCDTELYQKGVKSMLTKLFNMLPATITAINTFKGFKKEVKYLLLNNTFYSVDEFLHSELLVSVWRIFGHHCFVPFDVP